MDYPDRLLRTREAQLITGLSNGMFYSEIAAGRIKRLKIGRSSRYRLSDLLDYFDGLGETATTASNE